jgi:hypothetical protein
MRMVCLAASRQRQSGPKLNSNIMSVVFKMIIIATDSRVACCPKIPQDTEVDRLLTFVHSTVIQLT